jgi:hypothetical protein
MSPGAQSRDDTLVGGGEDERDGITTKSWARGERHPELTRLLGIVIEA